MPDNQLSLIDNLDDRKEIHRLLTKLPPVERVNFLRWACQQVPKNSKGHLPVPHVWKMRVTLEEAYRCDRADLAITNECYADLLVLISQWGLDAMKTVTALEYLVKRVGLKS